jgi:nucleoside-diphosphate-sugar epimerase
MVTTLAARGWRVRAFARAWPAASGPEQWLSGDVMDAQALSQAAAGVQVVVHAVNPPGYRHWETLALPMLRASMAVAGQQGARLLLPGNVYNFEAGGPGPWPEDAPQRPLTRKGRVRVTMEQALREAAERDGLKSLVLRAGDFFGAASPSSWFNTVMVQPGRPVQRVVDPHTPGVGHTWAYLPDAALAAARLLELDQAQPGKLALAERVHFKGHELADGRELAQSVVQAVARHEGRRVPIRAVPWWVLPTVAWASPLLREVSEMRYLWRQALALDNARLLSLIGEEPHTPLDEAVVAALGRQGSLAGRPAELRSSASAP